MPPIDPFPCGNGLHPCPPEPALATHNPNVDGATHPEVPFYTYNEMKKYGSECAEWGKKQPKP